MAENAALNDNEPGFAPSAVRITDYRVMPWPDGTRVTVELGLSPFRQFPAMDISVVDEDGRIVRTASVVGAMERRPAPTIHLPKLERGTTLVALVEMLDGDTVTQQLAVPFQVSGPIVKAAVEG